VQLLHLANRVHLQANVLRLPPVERLLTDPGLADHVYDERPSIGDRFPDSLSVLAFPTSARVHRIVISLGTKL
jgi:hypothetical protein